LKITDIKSYPLLIGHRNQLIVKVETDEGIYGIGESGLSGRERAVMGAVEHYRDILIGRDPMQIGALWQLMYRSQYFEGGRALTAAISAIDIALYDIAGKALNVPVYQLLGGKHREYVDCFASVGMGASVEDLISGMRTLLDSGWNVIRTGPYDPHRNTDKLIFEPRESLAVTADWLTQAREAIGSGPVLGIDYHHRLSVAEAASFCQRMPSGTLDFLEEPIRAETPEAYETLRTMTDIPFAIGEEFSSKWAFLPYIERGITNFARIDVCNVGGLTESMKVAAMAESHYVDLMPHNPLGIVCTMATLHLAAAVPNFAWLELRHSPSEQTIRYQSEFFESTWEQDGARLRVPEEPGLGVTFNEEAALKQTPNYDWNPPELRRRDGSLTNW
jgi:galactonate dehydratase